MDCHAAGAPCPRLNLDVLSGQDSSASSSRTSSSRSSRSSGADEALTPIAGSLKAHCSVATLRDNFIRNVLAHGHNHPLTDLVKVVFGSTHESLDPKELVCFFWNFDDECIKYLRNKAKLRTPESPARCLRAVQKKIQITIDYNEKKNGFIPAKQKILGGSFEEASKFYKLKTANDFFLNILQSLYNCMIIDAAESTLEVTNNCFDVHTGTNEKLALLLINFYRYSKLTDPTYAPPVGRNYADKVSSCIPSSISAETDEDSIFQLYRSLIIEAGFYGCIHFSNESLRKTHTLPRHIAKAFHSMPEFFSVQEKNTSPSGRSSSRQSLDTADDTTASSGSSEESSSSRTNSLTPPISDFTKMQTLTNRFNNHINELIDDFYAMLEGIIHDKTAANFCTLQQTFYEILNLKSQHALCFPRTNLCPFELGCLIVAAKRIKAAFGAYYRDRRCPKAIRDIATCNVFDNITLVRINHISKMTFAHPLATRDNGLEVGGGHIPSDLPYTTLCATDTREPAHMLCGRLLRVSPEARPYQSPRSGCISRSIVLSSPMIAESVCKTKTQFPACFNLDTNLPLYLETLLNSCVNIFQLPRLQHLEKHMYGKDLHAVKIVQILEHKHSLFCQESSCTASAEATIKIFLPQLILELPEGAGNINIILTAYPMGTDCYTSRRSLYEAQKLFPPKKKDTSSDKKKESEPERYAKLYKNTEKMLLEELSDETELSLIRRNIIITSDGNEIQTWRYLDDEKRVVGNVIIFNIESDYKILSNIAQIFNNESLQTAIPLVYNTLQPNSANKSIFIKILFDDFIRTIMHIEKKSDQEATELMQDFLVRNLLLMRNIKSNFIRAIPA